jgi:hypothetical protein
LVGPLVLFMLFSILEIGFMVKNRAELGQAAREAARLGAVGATPARMDEGIATSLTTIDDQEMNAIYDYRPWNEDSQNWGDWTQLGTDGDANSAPRRGQIRVRLTFDHSLLIPGVMGGILGADENGQIEIPAASVMMRE